MAPPCSYPLKTRRLDRCGPRPDNASRTAWRDAAKGETARFAFFADANAHWLFAAVFGTDPEERIGASGDSRMKIAIFCHSIISDWNHGNAHFLRGVASELIARGHRVRLYEPRNAWSLRNLIAQHGSEPIARFHRAYPQLTPVRYELDTLDL